MARRKSSVVREELQVTAKKLEELKTLQDLSEKEELDRLKDVEDKIKDIARINEMFYGLIITRKDLLNIIAVMMETGDPQCKLEAKMYYNE